MAGGKRGTLTPRATMAPVFLAGTTVQHASLHNIEEIERKDIRIGDTVLVEKAGEIIPQVVKPVLWRPNRSRAANRRPERCPSCGQPLVRVGPKIYCINTSCPAQIRKNCLGLPAETRWTLLGWGTSWCPAGRRWLGQHVCRLVASRCAKPHGVGKSCREVGDFIDRGH